MLFSGIVSLANAFYIKRAGQDWVLPMILASVTAVLGFVIIINPLAPVNIAVTVLGIALAAAGVANLISCLSGRHQLRYIEKQVKRSDKSGKDEFIDI